MSTTLLELMEDLLHAIEQRDAGDPDAPAWEASARIARLEEELASRLSAGGRQEAGIAVAAHARQSEEAAPVPA